MARMAIRQIRVQGNVAYVPLTQGHEAIIDAADVALVEGVNWCSKPTKWAVYAVRNTPRDSNGKQGWEAMHRVIMGATAGVFVDHISGDGLDNRRKNLRFATNTQNQHNRRLCRASTSGLKGASLHKPSGMWRARIRCSGKQYDLGSFDTAEEAHAAYCEASRRLHGEFGRVE